MDKRMPLAGRVIAKSSGRPGDPPGPQPATSEEDLVGGHGLGLRRRPSGQPDEDLQAPPRSSDERRAEGRRLAERAGREPGHDRD